MLYLYIDTLKVVVVETVIMWEFLNKISIINEVRMIDTVNMITDSHQHTSDILKFSS